MSILLFKKFYFQNITAEESEKMKDLRTATGCRKNVPGCTLLPLFNEPGSDAPPGQSGRFRMFL